MATTNVFSSFRQDAGGGNTQRLLGAVTSTSSNPVDFSMRIVDNALNRGAAGPNPQALLDALRAPIDAYTNTMDSDISTQASRGDEPKYWAIFGKPHRYGSSWDDGGYDEKVMLWSAIREDPETSRIGNTLGNICTLNYYAELSQVLKNEASIVSRDRVSSLRKQRELDYKYTYDGAREYTQKWNMLGPIHRPGEGSFNGQDVPSIGGAVGDRLVEYTYDGTAETNQLFSTHVREGDYLHFVVTKVRNPYNAIYLPNGCPTTARSGTAGEELLQVRGFSSSELPYVPGDSGHADGPLDDDLNYRERRAAAVAVRYEKVEWDNATNNIKVRSVAAEEGVQEALNYLSSVEYEAYTEGFAFPVGIAVDTSNGSAPTQRQLEAAHRSPKELSRLQTVSYLVARKLVV